MTCYRRKANRISKTDAQTLLRTTIPLFSVWFSLKFLFQFFSSFTFSIRFIHHSQSIRPSKVDSEQVRDDLFRSEKRVRRLFSISIRFLCGLLIFIYNFWFCLEFAFSSLLFNKFDRVYNWTVDNAYCLSVITVTLLAPERILLFSCFQSLQSFWLISRCLSVWSVKWSIWCALSRSN